MPQANPGKNAHSFSDMYLDAAVTMSQICQDTLDFGLLESVTVQWGVPYLATMVVAYGLSVGMSFRTDRSMSLIARIPMFDAFPSAVKQLLRALALLFVYPVPMALLLVWALVLIQNVEPDFVGVLGLTVGLTFHFASMGGWQFWAHAGRVTRMVAGLGSLALLSTLTWIFWLVMTTEPFSYHAFAASFLSVNACLVVYCVYVLESDVMVDMDRIGRNDLSPNDIIVRHHTTRGQMAAPVWVIATLVTVLFAALSQKLDSAVGLVGYIALGSTVVFDLLTAFVIQLPHRPSGRTIAFQIVLSRLLITAWGQQYWFIGHCVMFCLIGPVLSYLAASELISPPEDPRKTLLGDDADKKITNMDILANREADDEEEEEEGEGEEAGELDAVFAREGATREPVVPARLALALLTVLFAAEIAFVEQLDTFSPVVAVKRDIGQWAFGVPALIFTFLCLAIFLTFRLDKVTKGVSVKVVLAYLFVEGPMLGLGVTLVFFTGDNVWVLVLGGVWPLLALLHNILRSWRMSDYNNYPQDIFDVEATESKDDGMASGMNSSAVALEIMDTIEEEEATPFSWDAFFKLKYPWEVYEIAVCSFAYFVIAVADSVAIWLIHHTPWIALLAFYCVTALPLTILPLIKFFLGGRTKGDSILAWVACVLAVGESIGFAILSWEETFGLWDRRGSRLLGIPIAHVFVILAFSALQYMRNVMNSGGFFGQKLMKEEQKDLWQRLPRDSKTTLALGISAVVVLLAGIVVLIVLAPVPRWVGITAGCVWLILVLVGARLFVVGANDGEVSLVANLLTGAIVLVWIAAPIAISAESNGFTCVSVFAGICAFVLLLHGFATSDTIQQHTTYASAHGFPVYVYDTTLSDIRTENSAALSRLVFGLLVFVYGQFATIFFYPHYAGITATMVGISLVVIEILDLFFSNRVRFAETIQKVGSAATVNKQIDAAQYTQAVRRSPPVGWSFDEHLLYVRDWRRAEHDAVESNKSATLREDYEEVRTCDRRTIAYYWDNQMMVARLQHGMQMEANAAEQRKSVLLRRMIQSLGLDKLTDAQLKEYIEANPERWEEVVDEFILDSRKLADDLKERDAEEEQATKDRRARDFQRGHGKGSTSDEDEDSDEDSDEEESSEEYSEDGSMAPLALGAADLRSDDWSEMDEYTRTLRLYHKIKDQCEEEGALFVDADFPPERASLFYSKGSAGSKKDIRKTKTKRFSAFRRPQNLSLPKKNTPDEIELFRDIDAADVKQGALGNCWFISSVSVLGTEPELVKATFMEEERSPHGVYGVRFYKENKSQIITIDDQLPCNANGKPIYAQSKDQLELWPMLLEKAYAKLHGSYEALVAGRVADGLADLTGGIPQMIRTQQLNGPADVASGAMFAMIQRYFENGYLLGAGSPTGSKDTRVVQGIHQTHQYSVLRVAELNDIDPETNRKYQLIQLRNPWGKGEWTGKWSDKDKESWTKSRKKTLGWSSANDGTFWMSFQDFATMFPYLFVCKLYRGEWKVQTRWEFWRTPKKSPKPSEWSADYSRLIDTKEDLNTYHSTMHTWDLKITRPTSVVVYLAQNDERIGAKSMKDWNKMMREIRCDIWKRSKSLFGGKQLQNVCYSGTFAAAEFEDGYVPDVSVHCEAKLKPGDYVICCRAFGGKAAWKRKTRMIMKVYTEHSAELTPLERDDSELSSDFGQ